MVSQPTRPGITHYVRHNKVTRIPRSFIYLDSEALQRDVRGARVQTFRLAAAAYDRRYHHRDGWADREWGEFMSTDDLWDWVEARCGPKARTVLVAHKLDYDMRITDSFAQLVRRGWKLERIRLDATQAWAGWRKGTRSLAMTDSLSWVNMSLEKLGVMIGVPKLPLPPWDDTDEAWMARCRRDVEILADVYRRLIEWVKRDDLGNWKPTGAGQAWAAYRHKYMTHRLLVHESVDAREAERSACYTGRCEAWRHGKLHDGPFTEFDYSTAYARIGAECKIPVRLLGESSAMSLAQLDNVHKRYSVLADVIVSTDVPTVPTRVDGRIVWPVGKFRSTLWDTELTLARENGAHIEIERAWWYKREPALRDFCAWCLAVLDDRNTEVDPIVRAAVKHWSRALIGRFAARWPSWEQVGRSPVDDIALGWAHDVSSGERWKLLQLGGQLMRQTGEVDSPDAVVSVMSWVMAECRARLWRSAEVAGFGNVAYMDTDSLIVNRAGRERLLEAGLSGFRRKAEYDTLEILGPRQIITQGTLRASGVPRGAVRVSEREWEADAWAQLDTSIASGDSAAVRISTRRVRLRGTDSRRTHGPQNGTFPHVLDL